MNLLVSAGHKNEVYVPKLAIIVASPVIRNYFLQKPTAVKAKFVHPNISYNAVLSIAKWLKDVCTQQEFPELPVPDDVGDALKLRLTAHTLGMEQYTGLFDACYIDAIEERVPSLQEIDVVLDNTRKKDDVVLAALANRLMYLVRYHKLSPEMQKAFENVLALDKYEALRAAVNDEEVKAMAERAEEDV